MMASNKTMSTPNQTPAAATKPGQVVAIISSTRDDLIPYIEAARSACLQCDVFPLAAEGRAVPDQAGVEASLALLDKADVFIGIYGHRYGWAPEGSEISIQHIEYRCAERRKADGTLQEIVVFLIDEDAGVSSGHLESDIVNRDKLGSFKSEVSGQPNLRIFATPAQLEGQLVRVLNECLPGIRAKVAGREPVAIPEPPKPGVAGDLPARGEPADLTDRETEIACFHQLRGRHKPSRRPHLIVLAGMEGIGKTQLARHLGGLVAKESRRILVVDVGSPALFKESIAGLATSRHLAITDADRMDIDARFSLACAWLTLNGDWLLIIENANSQQSVNLLKLLLLPQEEVADLNPDGIVLINSRLHEWPTVFDRINLRLFSEDSGARFFRRRIGHDAGTEDEARELTRVLGGLPAALENAAVWIERHKLTLRGYIDDIVREHPGFAVNDVHGYTDYPAILEATKRKATA